MPNFQFQFRLGIGVGDRAPMKDVRETALGLRGGKGMLIDQPAVRCGARPQRWNSGSFFTNPMIPMEHLAPLPEDAPRYPVRSSTPKAA
ncbi:hypothetical protein [Promicromonospora sp. NPDC050262]|uniref:hypothetical protein n=1 Tax=Promicromonospora sp. NPDC050262 TaxID=3155036 RepID=UPI00340D66DD